jgi:hypothetical protein
MPNIITANESNIVVTSSTVVLTDLEIARINNQLAIGNQVVIDVNGQILTYPRTNTCSTNTFYINTPFIGSITSACTSTTTSIITPYQSIGIHTASTTNWGYYCNNSYIYQTPLYVKPKRGPLIKKSIRSSIKRAMKLIANFGMEEDLRVFFSGGGIEISHPESLLKFVISKKHNMLLSATERCGHHVPYNLALYTKTDIHVSDLCVYMEGTPILDQILAVSMFVKTGNEDCLLEKANWNSLTKNKEIATSLAISSPIIKEKLKMNRFIN